MLVASPLLSQASVHLAGEQAPETGVSVRADPGHGARREAQEAMQRGDYLRAVQSAQRQLKESPGDAEMRALLARAYFLGRNYEAAARVLQQEVQSSERSEQAPSELHLQWLLECYEQLGDGNGALWVLERLVIHHPKRAYWSSLLSLWQKKLGPDHRLTLDFLRLRRATGSITTAEDYLQLTAWALRSGAALEARGTLDEGFSKKILGVGPSADAHRTLRAQVQKQVEEEQKQLSSPDWETNAVAARNGMLLVNAGLSEVMRGEHVRGLSLMERGIRIGIPHAPQDAKLRLAIGYLNAGQRSKAIDLLRTVTGRGGAADLARLWEWYARQS
ncbi:tetratricopeptide repeat protein [Diaphorobacter caeni]|uniref:tetratricopeptide repeat protein n=1 Tax=Diaphorobacter caeni TaxID=2784387 RepID=UPI001890A8E1|nr:tetratricopeptide repeat protein [Diaphorobacter caeni]MBF5007326.1 tetratricopeptide repeat protein [Diaphorobacter caeni]